MGLRGVRGGGKGRAGAGGADGRRREREGDGGDRGRGWKVGCRGRGCGGRGCSRQAGTGGERQEGAPREGGCAGINEARAGGAKEKEENGVCEQVAAVGEQRGGTALCPAAWGCTDLGLHGPAALWGLSQGRGDWRGSPGSWEQLSSRCLLRVCSLQGTAAGCLSSVWSRRALGWSGGPAGPSGHWLLFWTNVGL